MGSSPSPSPPGSFFCLTLSHMRSPALEQIQEMTLPFGFSSGTAPFCLQNILWLKSSHKAEVGLLPPAHSFINRASSPVVNSQNQGRFPTFGLGKHTSRRIAGGIQNIQGFIFPGLLWVNFRSHNKLLLNSGITIKRLESLQKP